MSVHSFKERLEAGLDREKRIDAFFEQWYRIEAVPDDWQPLGIDRIWTEWSSRIRWTVEYKWDWQAARTGNAFIETIGVDIAGKLGWTLYSLAQLLVYGIEGQGRIYLLRMPGVKLAVPEWMERYRQVPARNEGYTTYGHPVPIQEVCRKGLIKAYDLSGTESEERERW